MCIRDSSKGQRIDDMSQHQRRHQSSQDGPADREQDAGGKEPVLRQGGENDLADRGCFVMFFCMPHDFIPPVLAYFL